MLSQVNQRFRAALDVPKEVQLKKLFNILEKNSGTVIGQRYKFSRLTSVSEYQRAVPLSTYPDYCDYISQIKEGRPKVLTAERVSRLHLTSGTAGNSKCIPFTQGLKREFFAGIGPWVANLIKFYPEILKGRHYWVLSPFCAPPAHELSEVPIGFDQDNEYLPQLFKFAHRKRAVVPANLAQVSEAEEFYLLTGLFLLLAKDLSLISLWSPSSMSLILEAIVSNRDRILRYIFEGGKYTNRSLRFNFRAEKKLARLLDKQLPLGLSDISSFNWNIVWPALRLISCWGDAWSKPLARKLREMFPESSIQDKGLLATEAFITLPYIARNQSAAAPLLSIVSHFFEFRDLISGGIYLVDELKLGRDYEVIVTTAGGLYRYLLGDKVRVEGFYKKTPCLAFLGRVGVVSDLCGEKLDNDLAEATLLKVCELNHLNPALMFLAPLINSNPARYCLFIDSNACVDVEKIADDLDRGLRNNFYYDQCRRAQQLGAPEIYPLSKLEQSKYWEIKAGSQRVSTVKWRALETSNEWESVFSVENKKRAGNL